MGKIFALIDCNNFYVSCERAFNPKLDGKPMVVLSGNDGCIIARSNEAKALGLPMCAPIYKYKDLIASHKVELYSSNFELVGDMSQRVMSTLSSFNEDLEIYSIDEAFLKLENRDDLTSYAHEIRSRIAKWTGIGVSIGLGPTKTLAKVASRAAKGESFQGVCDLREPTLQEKILRMMPIDEIWGIGRKWGSKLRSLGFLSAWQLKMAPAAHLRKHFGVMMERIVYELQGLCCLDIEEIQPRKSILCSRSFPHPVTDLETISGAIANYVATASEKLRKQKSRAGALYVFLRTNPHRKNDPQYNKGAFLNFLAPTQHTGEILEAATSCLKKIYREGFGYKKTGVILLDINNRELSQTNFLHPFNYQKSDKLMETLDFINHRFGKNSLIFATQIFGHRCARRSVYQSPRYTTCWDEIPFVK